MKLPAIFVALLLSTFCALAQDKKDVLKVKINNNYTIGERNRTIQFNYDTKEILQITNRKEDFNSGIFLLRHEPKDFKKLMDEMLKLCDTLWENKITGVKKKYNSADESTTMSSYTEVDRPENADVKDKKSITILFYYHTNPVSAENMKRFLARRGSGPIGRPFGNSQIWTYPELQELSKVFDDRISEVFKKYDILKALND